MRVSVLALIATIAVGGTALPAAAQPFANAKTLAGRIHRRRRRAAEGVREPVVVQGRGHHLDSGARRGRDGRHAAALPRDRRDHARGRVRGEPAGSLEPPLLHDRQRRPRRRRPRHADQCAIAPAALTNGFVHGAHQHRPRRAQGAERLVHPQQPAEGDRLRLSRRARDGRDGQEDRHRVLRAADHVLLLELLLERRPPGPARGAALSRTTSTASSPTRRGSIRPASRSARCGIRRR